MMTDIVEKVSYYVKTLFERHLSPDLTFHNQQHTLDVVQAVILIGKQCEIAPEALEILKIAACFHDSGYCFGYVNHEAKSINLASHFLTQQHCTPDFIRKVSRLIDATRFPQQLVGLLEQIICDADLAHLSKTDYPIYADRLRQEWQLCLKKTYSDKAWLHDNLSLLNNHHYFTVYGMIWLQPGQQQNAALIAAQLDNKC
jgi:predicted metal-dependent HD superfamily phosphohydrolase